MALIADITYRNASPSDWLNADIHKHVARLRSYCADLQSCRVLVEIPHRHREQGNHFRVRIDVIVPGGKIVAGHELSPGIEGDRDRNLSHRRRTETEAVRKDAARTFRRAFLAVKRQLQDYARRRRLSSRHELFRGERWGQVRRRATVQFIP
jgi:hypothetical protein